MRRDIGIDHIRILLTFLVVFHHVAIVYGGAGGWYWKEQVPTVIGLVVFNTINQSFFMGMFFLLAGYFSRGSVEKKGISVFLKDRFIRLGIPLVVYFFILSPLTIALANPVVGVSFLVQTSNMVKANVFEPGPLWFAEALLIFSIVISVLHKYFPVSIISLKTIPTYSKLVILSLSISIITFCVRLFLPVGQSLLWLQLGYFPFYIFLFYLGYIAAPNKLLTSIAKEKMMPWLITSIIAIATLPFVISSPFGAGKFEGGININAAFYAMWEPLAAWGIIFGLLWFFSKCANGESAASTFLSRNAYAIYIIHPFFVVLVSRSLAGLDVDMLIKLILNGVLSIVLCALTAWIMLKIPLVSKVL
jgi:glucans biosynthesis protein C